MIERVTTSGFTSAELPEKFEAGTPPIAEAIGLAAAVRYLNDLGLERIADYEHALCQFVDEKLRQLDGVDVIGPAPEHKCGIVSFDVNAIHAHDVSQVLDQQGIAVRAGHHCAMPLHRSLNLTATTRASFYFYNRWDEAERLVEAVQQVQRRLAPSGRRRHRR